MGLVALNCSVIREQTPSRPSSAHDSYRQDRTPRGIKEELERSWLACSARARGSLGRDLRSQGIQAFGPVRLVRGTVHCLQLVPLAVRKRRDVRKVQVQAARLVLADMPDGPGPSPTLKEAEAATRRADAQDRWASVPVDPGVVPERHRARENASANAERPRGHAELRGGLCRLYTATFRARHLPRAVVLYISQLRGGADWMLLCLWHLLFQETPKAKS